jgi:hypothetical protein
MRPEVLKLAISIMDEVLRHPGAVLFSDPPKPGPDFPEDYFEIVKHPMDLSTVATRLKSRRYRTVSDWTRAFDLVFANATTYYGAGDIVDLGDEIHAVFQKQCERFNLLTVEGWAAEVLRRRDQIAKLNSEAPFPPVLKSLIKNDQIGSQLATPAIVSTLVSGMQKAKDADTHREVGKILEAGNPELKLTEGKNTLDIIALAPASVLQVARYLRSREDE